MAHRGSVLFVLVLSGSGCDASAGPPGAPASTIRVLAYNIHHGEGLDGQLDLLRTAGVIRRAEPDVVALQEVDRHALRTNAVDQAATLGVLTGLTPTYGPFMDFDGGSYGMAILSRWEVVR